MNKTILITGATDGIGKQIAYELAIGGFHIILHGRNEEKCKQTVAELQANFPESVIEHISADFTSLSNVRRMADTIQERYDRLDVLINNAGIYNTHREINPDGFETNLTVNYLAVFVLTKNLQNLLQKSAPARIVNVSSIAHKRGRIDIEHLTNQPGQFFDSYKAYADSKLMLMYFTYFLADELSGTGVTVNALHPGVVSTKMLKDGFNMTGVDVSIGAETPVYLATSPEVEGVTGLYFDKKISVPSSRLSYDLLAREEVITWTKKTMKAGGWI
ncbi:MAG: SDR family oxidoreductase [Anaerolineaceae bacterium]|nr:SDR family oxidoreductase [Anaerolineaceae bacterium]